MLLVCYRMSFDDWKKHFRELQICYLTPESSVIDYVSIVPNKRLE